jgi:hypothetical protein
MGSGYGGTATPRSDGSALMVVEPFVDGSGQAHQRERVAYLPAVVIDDRGGFSIALLPPEPGVTLTCHEFVGIFSLRLLPGTSRAAAEALASEMGRLGVGWEAAYSSDPDRPMPPTFPNVVRLRAA